MQTFPALYFSCAAFSRAAGENFLRYINAFASPGRARFTFPLSAMRKILSTNFFRKRLLLFFACASVGRETCRTADSPKNSRTRALSGIRIFV
ncbi:MAG: hypothetical protein DBX55_00315 [Verrucomicrobia bacterium]|nr:MAG: hypothetical protein DBX55_00315 [Verrucomicrobiota bacterium]